MVALDELSPEERELKIMLGEARTIAVVGLSDDARRPSHAVAEYLQDHGYKIIPVNPHVAEVLGEPALDSLDDVPSDVHVDVVDVFRRPEHTPEIARQAVRIGAGVLWLQEGIVNEEAANIAYDGGLKVIMGMCIRHVRERLEGGDP